MTSATRLGISATSLNALPCSADIPTGAAGPSGPKDPRRRRESDLRDDLGPWPRHVRAASVGWPVSATYPVRTGQADLVPGAGYATPDNRFRLALHSAGGSRRQRCSLHQLGAAQLGPVQLRSSTL